MACLQVALDMVVPLDSSVRILLGPCAAGNVVVMACCEGWAIIPDAEAKPLEIYLPADDETGIRNYTVP